MHEGLFTRGRCVDALLDRSLARLLRGRSSKARSSSADAMLVTHKCQRAGATVSAPADFEVSVRMRGNGADTQFEGMLAQTSLAGTP